MANPNPKIDQIKPYQYQPGQAGGYRGGAKTRSLTALLRQAAEKRELFGQPMPEGQDVAETFADACFAWAIKGNATFATQVLDRLEGKVPNVEPAPAPSSTMNADAVRQAKERAIARKERMSGTDG